MSTHYNDGRNRTIINRLLLLDSDLHANFEKLHPNAADADIRSMLELEAIKYAFGTELPPIKSLTSLFSIRSPGFVYQGLEHDVLQ